MQPPVGGGERKSGVEVVAALSMVGSASPGQRQREFGGRGGGRFVDGWERESEAEASNISTSGTVSSR